MTQLFKGYKDLIQEGDLVIISVHHEDKKVITVKDGEVTQTAKGAIRHGGLINFPYGGLYKATKGDVYCLFPTPELWSLSLPHRTQIIYSHDISVIISELDLKPNDIVLESGTGSGSLTHALARSVLPNGKVFTCEFHQDRVKKARVEFEEHGLGKTISCFYRDICHDVNSDNQIDPNEEPLTIQNGFPKNSNATAVILDVPKPWLALKSAYNSMDRNKLLRFCTFSPCIEQVQKTVIFAYENFKHLVREMKTVEFNCKPCNVRNNKLPFANLGMDLEKDLDMTEKEIPQNFGDKIPGLAGYLSLQQVKSLGDAITEPKSKIRKTDSKESDSMTDDGFDKQVFFNHLHTTSGTKIYGHTGYLTFFSIIPDIENE